MFPSPSLGYYFLLSPRFFPGGVFLWRVCYRKETVHPPSSSHSSAVFIPLLLSSALPLNAEPGSHAARKIHAVCRSASIHFTEGRCVYGKEGKPCFRSLSAPHGPNSLNQIILLTFLLVLFGFSSCFHARHLT